MKIFPTTMFKTNPKKAMILPLMLAGAMTTATMTAKATNNRVSEPTTVTTLISSEGAKALAASAAPQTKEYVAPHVHHSFTRLKGRLDRAGLYNSNIIKNAYVQSLVVTPQHILDQQELKKLFSYSYKYGYSSFQIERVLGRFFNEYEKVYTENLFEQKLQSFEASLAVDKFMRVTLREKGLVTSEDVVEYNAKTKAFLNAMNNFKGPQKENFSFKEYVAYKMYLIDKAVMNKLFRDETGAPANDDVNKFYEKQTSPLYLYDEYENKTGSTLPGIDSFAERNGYQNEYNKLISSSEYKTSASSIKNVLLFDFKVKCVIEMLYNDYANKHPEKYSSINGAKDAIITYLENYLSRSFSMLDDPNETDLARKNISQGDWHDFLRYSMRRKKDDLPYYFSPKWSENKAENYLYPEIALYMDFVHFVAKYYNKQYGLSDLPSVPFGSKTEFELEFNSL